MRRLHRMEERQSHRMTNAEKNQKDHRENLDGKGKDECIQRQSRRDRASEREGKELQLSEVQEMC